MSDSFYEQLATWSQVVASILFIIALVYMWIRFITPAVLASQARKNAELAEAQARSDAARAEVGVARQELSGAADEVRAILARADADATRIRERILGAADAERARVVRNAEGELERGRAGARDQLRTELLEKAMLIARGAASRLDDTMNRRLVDDALDTAARSEHA